MLDILFESSSCRPKGSFKSVSAFHDWFTTLKRPVSLRGPEAPPHSNRSWLPDNVPIVFTHSDLHRSNIIISRKTSGPVPRVFFLLLIGTNLDGTLRIGNFARRGGQRIMEKNGSKNIFLRSWNPFPNMRNGTTSYLDLESNKKHIKWLFIFT